MATITTRKKDGNKFTSKDIIEVNLNTEGENLSSCSHTIEIVSGVQATHGGGAEAGDYLHYKNENDRVDGWIDYSSTDMHVEQLEKGTTVLIVDVAYITEDNANAIQALEDEGTILTEEELAVYEDYLTSNEITIEWGEDTFN